MGVLTIMVIWNSQIPVSGSHGTGPDSPVPPPVDGGDAHDVARVLHRRRGLGDQRVQQALDPTVAMSGAVAVGARALVEDQLEVAQRIDAAGLANVWLGDRDRGPGDLGK